MVAIIIWFFLNPCSKQLAFEANHSLISYNNTLLPLFSPIHFISNLLLYKAGTKLAKSSLSRSQLSGEDKRMWSGGICLRSEARNSSRRGLTLVCDDALWRNSAIDREYSFQNHWWTTLLPCKQWFLSDQDKAFGKWIPSSTNREEDYEDSGDGIRPPQRRACFVSDFPSLHGLWEVQ